MFSHYFPVSWLLMSPAFLLPSSGHKAPLQLVTNGSSWTRLSSSHLKVHLCSVL